MPRARSLVLLTSKAKAIQFHLPLIKGKVQPCNPHTGHGKQIMDEAYLPFEHVPGVEHACGRRLVLLLASHHLKSHRFSISGHISAALYHIIRAHQISARITAVQVTSSQHFRSVSQASSTLAAVGSFSSSHPSTSSHVHHSTPGNCPHHSISGHATHSTSKQVAANQATSITAHQHISKAHQVTSFYHSTSGHATHRTANQATAAEYTRSHHYRHR